MADGDFTSSTLQAAGATLRLLFAYATAPTASTDPALWPYLTIGAGGNANTLRCLTIGTPTDNGDGNYYVDCVLTGYGYASESIVVDVPAAFLTNGTTSAAVSDGAVTNSSADTQGDAYTRFKGVPIAAWAIIDRWWQHDSLAAIPIALDAIDNWAGIVHVDLALTLAGSTTVNTDAAVTDQGGSVYRISGKRLLDLHGKGQLPYWYLNIDASAAADGTVCTVTEVTVRTNDGVDHALIADDRMSQRVIRKLASPTTLYVDGTATGAADGSSWADAFTTIAAAETVASTTAELIKIAPGTYAITQDFDQSRSPATHDWLLWEADLTQAGDASGVVTFTDTTASRNIRALNCLKDVTYNLGTTSLLRFASAYACLHGTSPTCTDKTQASSPVTIQGVSHISIIGGTFTNGNKITVGAVGGSRPSNLLIHQPTFDTLGTSFTGTLHKAMIDGFTEVNGNTDTALGTHTDGVHSYQTVSLSGVTYTEATKVISKAAAFTNCVAYSSANTILGASLYTTGGTGVTTGVEYPISSKIDNNSAQSVRDMTSGSGDITDLAGSWRGLGAEDVIIRNGFQYDGGDAANDKTQNIALLEGGCRNYAIYNWRHKNAMSAQQVLQIQNFYDNIQIVGVTSAPTDNDAQGDERGLAMSSIISESDDWYYRGRVLVRNCVFPTASVSSPGSLTNLANIRAGLFGPNYYSNASPSNPTRVLHTMDGSAVDAGSGGIAAFGFVDWAASPPDLRPTASSALLSGVTPAKDDRRFDALNIAIADNTPLAVGAALSPAPTITGIDPATVPLGASGTWVITGTGFVDGITPTVDGGVTLGATIWNSSTEIEVDYAPAITVGSWVLTLTNPDGQIDTIAFTVTAASGIAATMAPPGGRRRRFL